MHAASAVVKPFNPNVASLITMLTAMSELPEEDVVAPKYGTHRLEDFFKETYYGKIITEDNDYPIREVVVSSGNRFIRELDIQKPSKLCWEFTTVNKDIAFSVQDENNKVKTLLLFFCFQYSVFFPEETRATE
jgi:hypothetical protein